MLNTKQHCVKIICKQVNVNTIRDVNSLMEIFSSTWIYLNQIIINKNNVDIVIMNQNVLTNINAYTIINIMGKQQIQIKNYR